MTELHSSDLNFHLVPPTDKSSGVSYILDNLLNYLNQNEFNVHAKVIGRLTKTPFVHISHQFWQNHTELTYAPSFYLVAKVNCDELLNLNTFTPSSTICCCRSLSRSCVMVIVAVLQDFFTS